MRILVVGGAGYIGSHMSKLLVETGHEITVFDNLSTGHREAVRWGDLVQGELSDAQCLLETFRGGSFDAVMHFAAASIVRESVADPLRYYRNNFANVLTLLDVMRQCDVRNFVFSSTAAVYGEPVQDYIDEQHPLHPINPYGMSKLMVERALADCAAAFGLHAVALRYFNAAGADRSGTIGESHHPETHLIPNLLRLAAGEKLEVRIFGDDYPTADGTCIRDYIHVDDLCRAHLLALDHVKGMDGGGFQALNLGNGKGHTVKEIVSAVETVVGRKLGIEVSKRRPGDPTRLVADAAKARSVLGWQPEIGSIEDIIETAWKWHRQPFY